MKFKATIILLAIFIALLAFVLVFEKKSKEKEKLKAQEEKLVQLTSADVQKIMFKKEGETLSFKKDDKGEWLITEPMEVKADTYEANQLAENFSDLRIERVVEKEAKDLKKYQIPQKEISLWVKDKDQPTKVLIGMANPLDNTFFAQKEGDKRVVLLSSSLKSILDKKLFDFRQKEIFKFETGDIKGIKLQAPETKWEAQKKEEDWFFEKPLLAMAKASKIENILGTLSNLKAKEFVSEEKKPEELKKFGLEKPEYNITLAMPLANKEVTFFFHKDKDKTYATTSLSTKIIVPESDVFLDLDKKIDELRENKVSVFNSWQANKLWLRKGELNLTMVKNPNDKWTFERTKAEEADSSKVETFIRKIESLESKEFIDNPKGLSAYGLDKPLAEVKIWTKEEGEKPKVKMIHVLIGKEDKEKKQVTVKNSSLNYLFSVDSTFLDEFPKELKDWKAPEKEPETKEKSK